MVFLEIFIKIYVQMPLQNTAKILYLLLFFTNSKKFTCRKII